MAADQHRGQFSGALRCHCKLADLKLQRLLKRTDEWVARHPLIADVIDRTTIAPTQVDTSPLLGISLAQRNIRTMIWANGLQPDYRWLDMPAFDHKGALMHNGAVVCVDGVYAMGLPLMRRRKSSFIH